IQFNYIQLQFEERCGCVIKTGIHQLHSAYFRREQSHLVNVGAAGGQIVDVPIESAKRHTHITLCLHHQILLHASSWGSLHKIDLGQKLIPAYQFRAESLYVSGTHKTSDEDAWFISVAEEDSNFSNPFRTEVHHLLGDEDGVYLVILVL